MTERAKEGQLDAVIDRMSLARRRLDAARAADAPVPSTTNVQVNTKVELDGREIASGVATHIARSGAGPSQGTTGADISAGTFGGLQGVGF